MFAAGIGQASSRPTLHTNTNTMTTSTITWHKPDNLPDAQTNVLIALNVDGIRTSCEGFLDSSPHAPSADADGAPNHDGMQWYDVTAQPLDHAHVIGWAELPACPI